jgi:hypothetical protein
MYRYYIRTVVNLRNAPSAPNSFGRGPSSWLRPNARKRKLIKSPSSVGIVPLTRLLVIWRRSKKQKEVICQSRIDHTYGSASHTTEQLT